MSSRRKTAGNLVGDLGRGIGEGLVRVDPVSLGRGIGDGLERVHDAWLTEGKLAVPQFCRQVVQASATGFELMSCGAGPFSSLTAYRKHLKNRHSVKPDGQWMGDRERAAILEETRRRAFREAMNGSHP